MKNGSFLKQNPVSGEHYENIVIDLYHTLRERAYLEAAYLKKYQTPFLYIKPLAGTLPPISRSPHPRVDSSRTR